MAGITADQDKDDDPDRNRPDDEAPETPLDEPPPVPVRDPPPTPDGRDPYVVDSLPGVPGRESVSRDSTHAPEV